MLAWRLSNTLDAGFCVEALDGKTPAEAYRSNPPVDMMDKLLRALPTPSQAQQQRQADLSKEILAV